MKMVFLATTLLCAGIFLLSFGIHISNFGMMCIGGALVGVYNAMIYKQD